MQTISVTRKVTNVVMLTVTGLCTLVVVSVLFFILGYLLWHGGRSLTLQFFTQLPKPTGETGGGMANAIVGSGKILLLASLIGVPIGFLAGVYLSEYSGKTFAFVIRYVTDLLNGVPSIVIGIVAYTLVVLPMKHFSTLAGGIALGIMMIPIAVRTTEEFLRSIPNSLREGALALGATKVADHLYGGRAGRHVRPHLRHDAQPGARRRRNRAAAVHRARQHVLEPRLASAQRRAAGHDLPIRHLSLRRLASTGLGRRLRAARSRAYN